VKAEPLQPAEAEGVEQFFEGLDLVSIYAGPIRSTSGRTADEKIADVKAALAENPERVSIAGALFENFAADGASLFVPLRLEMSPRQNLLRVDSQGD